MQIENSEQIRQRIGRLIADRNLNVNMNRTLAAAVNGSRPPENLAEIDETAERYRQGMKEKKVDLTPEEARVMTILMGLVKDRYADLFKNAADENYVMACIAKFSRWFTKDTFAENPFLKKIRLENVGAGDYRIGQIAFLPGQLFVYNTPKRGPLRAIDMPRIAAFNEEVRFPAILKERRAVKAVTPNEILTIDPHIRAAKGNVLALGCGMSYFAYMASLKENVKTVTVVEKDPAILEIFEDHLLPQMETKDKITVMEDDPVDFVSDLDDGIYDRCFSNYGDLDGYLALVKACHRFREMKTTYWLEDAFCTNLVTYVYLVILNSFYKAAGLKELDFSKAPEGEKKRFAMIDQLLANASVERPEQIDSYMDPANLVYLLR